MSIEKRTGWFLLVLVLALASLVARFTVSNSQDWSHFGAVFFAVLAFAIIFWPMIISWATYTIRNPVRVVQVGFGAWAAISFTYNFMVYFGKLVLPNALVNLISGWAGWTGNLVFVVDIQVAIFLVLISLLASTHIALKHMRDLPENVKSVEAAAKRVSKYGVNNAGQALNIVGRLLSLKEFSEARKNEHYGSSTDALAAIACNLGNWENHVLNHSKPARKSSILTEVWLRSQSAYFLEEGYEIGNKSMATNGRNFCFLLLATLDAFVSRANSDETVCYTAVTPVSPEDWYNWPHGYSAHKKHFENEFVGDFQRVLREYLRREDSDKLEHSRYLLIARDSSGSERDKPKQFGWELSAERNFRKDIQGWTVPVSVKLQALGVLQMTSTDAHYEYGTKLHGYFNETRRVKEMIDDDKPVYVTPTFSERWDSGIKGDIGTPPEPEVVLALIDMACKDHLNAAIKIKEQLSDGATKRLDSEACNDEVEEMLSNSLSCIEHLMTSGEAGSDVDSFLGWLKDSHSVEANLAEVSSKCAQKFHRLRYHVLRFRDGYHYLQRKDDLNDDLSIGNVFATFLHSKPERSRVAILDQDQLEELKNNKVQPEFHLFGIRKTTPENGTNEAPDWKLLVTTLLDYPFEVTRITLNDEPEDEVFKKHVEFLGTLAEDEGTGDSGSQLSKPLKTFINKSEAE